MVEVLSILNAKFIFLVCLGSVAGLFVGAIPGLSVSMATALLVSITYTWETTNALATIMGVYVVGVFSGAVSAILINIPGAPSSVVTTLDGYPMARKGKAYEALFYATIYSFIGSIFGLLALALLTGPVSSIAIDFRPMDYFLLALFGLTTVGSVTGKDFSKGMIAAALGLLISMVGLDPIAGSKRLVFGVKELHAGISTVPALVGLFGFAEVLSVVFSGHMEQTVEHIETTHVSLKEVLRHWKLSLYTSLMGTLVGALPGAGGPVAAFLSYNEAKRLVKNPDVPFGEGAVEGIVASESSNNACIGGALIPMLTLAIPGDAVTAIILSVFYVHGLKPGPMFIRESASSFHAILAAGFIACFVLLILGLIVAPRICKVIAIPKNILLPVVTVLCVVGSFACNNRLFDVGLMFLFGLLGFLMRLRSYPVAPLVLALVLGKTMDSNFRRAMALAIVSDNPLGSLFGYPITMILLVCTVLVILGNIPFFKNRKARKRTA